PPTAPLDRAGRARRSRRAPRSPSVRLFVPADRGSARRTSCRRARRRSSGAPGYDIGLGERALARHAHDGWKNLMLRSLAGVEGLGAAVDEFAEAAAEPGNRNLALGHEGREQLRPPALIAIKPPGLDQLGAGLFVVSVHGWPPHSAVIPCIAAPS